MSILSLFSKSIINELKDWQKKLESLLNFINEYQKTETKWNCLKHLFSGEDIVKIY